MSEQTKDQEVNYLPDFISNMIKLESPVKKINFDGVLNRNAIIGLYIMAVDEAAEYIKNNADTSNLNDDTVLLFDKHHLFELGQAIFGILALLKKSNVLADDCNSLDIVLAFMESCSSYITYRKYKQNLISISALIKLKEHWRLHAILDRFKDIMTYLPFVPYNHIDAIAKMALEYATKKENEEPKQN